MERSLRQSVRRIIREAAMLAQIMYEETHLRPTIFTRDQILGGKV